ncbi:Conserved_hypothetical protein [Hexamita inflata]|uniref:Myb-like DNA-binding domain-containing protein n=1 Tax=Hexamita inflata TaxID=28002 RepID=A0AA86PRM7_9EUKA|nr:Conserved hypothetical protein [Hexamita inflata]
MVRVVVRWTEEETALLNKLVQQYNKNFKLVASAFPSRSYNQVKSHYFNVLHKIQIHLENIHIETIQYCDQEVKTEESTTNDESTTNYQDTSLYVFQELFDEVQ